MNAKHLLNYINPDVRELEAYHLTPETVAVKLNQNENPYDWPQGIKDEVAEFCRTRHWNRYPNFVPDDLKLALAEYTGQAPENILVGNGSNEMLLVLLLALTRHASPVIICQPTFTLYKLLSVGMGRDLHSVFLTDTMHFDLEKIVALSSSMPDALLILCSPNNPTGSALREQELRRLLECHAGFMLLDQAYVEFGGFDAVPLLQEYPNLIITRTLSKALRGAGIRLGYMLGNAEIIREINKIKLPYNINFFTEQVAMMLLAHSTELTGAIRTIQQERDKLFAFLTTLPLDAVYPSEANFILIQTMRKTALFSFLKECGILIRDVSSYPMLSNCLRISIGTEQENTLLKQKLTLFFQTTNK